MEKYAYTNPSAEQSQNEVIRSIDDGVTCRVENLPRSQWAPVNRRRPVVVDTDDTMRTVHPSSRGSGEEGVRFLLDGDDDRSSQIPSLTAPRGMTRSPSSFASFDQLFGGVEDFQYPLPPVYGRTDSDKGFYSDDSPDSPIEKPGYKREDSVHMRMCQSSLRKLIRESWENTGSFRSFQRRLGPYLNDKYCMRLKIHATIFMFIHVLYGAALLIMGTFTWNRLTGVDPIVGTYLLVTGVLSVFMFPIIIMEWSPRVGGCLDEETGLEYSYFFTIALILRVCACVAGTVCVYYRYPIYFGPEADPDFGSHKYEFLAVGVSVIVDWSTFFVSVILPTGCCLCCYCCARTRVCRPSRKKLLKEKFDIINTS